MKTDDLIKQLANPYYIVNNDKINKYQHILRLAYYSFIILYVLSFVSSTKK